MTTFEELNIEEYASELLTRYQNFATSYEALPSDIQLFRRMGGELYCVRFEKEMAWCLNSFYFEPKENELKEFVEFVFSDNPNVQWALQN